MKQAKRDLMIRQILQHGEKLNRVFNLHADPLDLCKKLMRLERKAHKLAEDACNYEIDYDEQDRKYERILASVDNLLNYTKNQIPVFVNRDPRGYALKIKEEYIKEHGLDIYKDWGGYGIIAPDFTPDN